MLNLNHAFTVDRFTPWIKIQLIKIIGVSAGSFSRRIIEKTEELIFETALHSKQNSSIRKFDAITGIQNRSLCQVYLLAELSPEPDLVPASRELWAY